MHAADLSFRLNPSLALQAGQLGHVQPVSPRHAGSRKRAGPDRDRKGAGFSGYGQPACCEPRAGGSGGDRRLTGLLRWRSADTGPLAR